MPKIARSDRARRAAWGFSFLEVLIVLSATVLTVGVLFTLSIVSQRTFVSSEATLQVQQQARQALMSMTKELRRADSVLIAKAAGVAPPLGCGAVACCAGAQCEFQLVLGFDMVPPCAAGVACVGAQDANRVNQANWRLRYRVNGAQLLREILDDGGALMGTRVLANDVAQLSFSYDAAKRMVTAQVETRQTSSQLPGQVRSVTPTQTPITTRVRLRN
ncbi:MAG: hypothetical protein HY737_06925 [Candidatus Omnitrophica bacterium]|nr:hypothetical protein [Candidatus Omnitrophota bacterium]